MDGLLGARAGRPEIYCGLERPLAARMPPSKEPYGKWRLKYIGGKMPNFMISYYGGNNLGSQEEGMAQIEKWKAWVKGLGETIGNL
ncbi:MAG: hypothetical protein VCE91_07690 [Nitrospinota bacterium]